jgi:hypothetical protein
VVVALATVVVAVETVLAGSVTPLEVLWGGAVVEDENDPAIRRGGIGEPWAAPRGWAASQPAAIASRRKTDTTIRPPFETPMREPLPSAS